MPPKELTQAERESFTTAALTLANKLRRELIDDTRNWLTPNAWGYIWELEGVLSVLGAMPGETVTEYGVLIDSATGERKD